MPSQTVRWSQWLRQAYYLGLLIYSLPSLDLALSSVELVWKYCPARIELIPFSDGLRAVSDLGSLLTDILVDALGVTLGAGRVHGMRSHLAGRPESWLRVAWSPPPRWGFPCGSVILKGVMMADRCDLIWCQWRVSAA